jgi:hypothetical protein
MKTQWKNNMTSKYGSTKKEERNQGALPFPLFFLLGCFDDFFPRDAF